MSYGNSSSSRMATTPNSIEVMNGGIGLGRGRGRGRGIRNQPSWMTQSSQSSSLNRALPEASHKATLEKRKRDSSSPKDSGRMSGITPDQELEREKELPQKEEIIQEEARLRQEEERENAELEKLAESLLEGNEEGEEDMFMLESANEREERLAQERRERRRNRRKANNAEQNDAESHSNNHKRQKIEEVAMEDFAQTEALVLETPSIREHVHEEPKSAMAADQEDGTDSFDMFSSSISPPTNKAQKVRTAPTNGTIIGAVAADDHDDGEGYYRTTIGEVITFQPEPVMKVSFKVLGIIGKGVFSTVLKCIRLKELGVQEEQDVVAMKLIRSNETMAKAALKEARILRLLCSHPTVSKKRKKKENEREEKYRKHNFYIVQMLELESFCAMGTDKHFIESSKQPLLEYRSHTTLLFEHMPMNLRETLSKFGKNIGISLKAIRSYAKQLLVALQHLAHHRVVHADIKPDNILVSANFQSVKLCDFGSAFFETDPDNDPTPYLVSRFYRAPEIIMGLEYDRSMDLWSIAVSLAELYTGNVLFAGRSNNDMLKRFMETIGPFSNKMIKRHVLNYSTKMGLVPYFEASPSGGTYNFRQQEFDKVTGKPVIRVLLASAVATKSLSQILLRSKSAHDNRSDVLKFADFLGRLLALDSARRIGVDEALNHSFLVNPDD